MSRDDQKASPWSKIFMASEKAQTHTQEHVQDVDLVFECEQCQVRLQTDQTNIKLLGHCEGLPSRLLVARNGEDNGHYGAYEHRQWWRRRWHMSMCSIERENTSKHQKTLEKTTNLPTIWLVFKPGSRVTSSRLKHRRRRRCCRITLASDIDRPEPIVKEAFWW